MRVGCLKFIMEEDENRETQEEQSLSDIFFKEACISKISICNLHYTFDKIIEWLCTTCFCIH
ncbi:hypothetical protein CICLE_v10023251mg [Citrus x clementina]|uniref:Uncharacterized protein n=1 Tax=Citrus clementina TaxID=85681 RepID=V4TQF6_CITCL|nr:hypothetical protein CICLE_v10023251mg [Citrus x clementina]ESR55638.1 hypothetical protein CICLE_v10023251mg [Citrus x clementina]